MAQNLTTSPTAASLASIKAKMSSAFTSLPMDESLADGIGASYGIIHYRGKVWSLSYRGQTHLFTRADDGSPANYIDVVFLRQARNKSKSFYEGFDQENMSKRPICASMDGVTPDADVETPQAKACAICPREMWKTDKNGKRTKECSDFKRLAVLLMPSATARMLGGNGLMEPVFLRIPAASLAALATYGKALEDAGIHYSGLVTRISFDPTKSHPQFLFDGVQALTEAEEPVVMSLREDSTSKRIVGEDPQRLAALAAPAQPITLPPPTVATGLAAHATASLAASESVKATAELIPPASKPSKGTAAKLNVADVGQAEPADAELDARLAGLLPRL